MSAIAVEGAYSKRGGVMKMCGFSARGGVRRLSMARTMNSFLKVAINLVVVVTCAMPLENLRAQPSKLSPARTLDSSEQIGAMAWSPDGRLIAEVNSSDNRVRLWDIETERRLWKLDKTGPGRPRGLLFSKDGKYVITSSAIAFGLTNNETTVSLIDVAKGQYASHLVDEKPQIGSNFALHSTFSPDKDVLGVVLGEASGRIALYDTQTWSVIGHVGPIVNAHGWPTGIFQIGLDMGRDLAVYGLVDGEVQSWSISRNALICSFRAYDVGLRVLTLNPASGEILTGGDGVTKVRPLAVGEPFRGEGLEDPPEELVRAWDPQSGKLLRIYRGAGGGVSSLAVSPDGRFIAATKLRGHVLVWDAASGAVVGEADYGDKWVGGAAFSSDSHKLAYAVGSTIHIVELGRD
jgi:WD40 repeat protein